MRRIFFAVVVLVCSGLAGCASVQVSYTHSRVGTIAVQLR